jgi:hypothetical protein
LISALPSCPRYKPDLRRTSLVAMLLEIIMWREVQPAPRNLFECASRSIP